jgi:hypothetical protein
MGVKGNEKHYHIYATEILFKLNIHIGRGTRRTPTKYMRGKGTTSSGV